MAEYVNFTFIPEFGTPQQLRVFYESSYESKINIGANWTMILKSHKDGTIWLRYNATNASDILIEEIIHVYDAMVGIRIESALDKNIIFLKELNLLLPTYFT